MKLRGTVFLVVMLVLVVVVCAVEAPAAHLSPLSHRGTAWYRGLHAASLPTSSASELALPIASAPGLALLTGDPLWLLARSIDHPPEVST